MSCDDVQADLSALLDEALGPAERARVEAHIMDCSDCRRELDRLRQTVALLRGLEPVRAPAGFVERVLAAAGPAPGVAWPARLGRWLFQPLRVKLPLEAAAVLLVAVTALYVWERTPEVRQAARQDGPAAPAPSTILPAPAAPASRPASTPPAETGGARDAASRLAAKESAPAEAKREEERKEADQLGRTTEAPAASGPAPAAKAAESGAERSGAPAAPSSPSTHRFAARALVAVDVSGRLRVADRA
ncbi:MAG TPA: anti-sigma factor, partial [Methylomirabilota bacterium]|nr:anti-sigma factor [Methylomirabilota bacterium]